MHASKYKGFHLNTSLNLSSSSEKMQPNVAFLLSLFFFCRKKRNTFAFYNTRKAKAASGRLSFEQGYNQTCHYYQNLHTEIPKLHAKFHQNPWCGFGEKCEHDNDIV